MSYFYFTNETRALRLEAYLPIKNLPSGCTQAHCRGHHHTAGLTWGTLGEKVHFPRGVHVPRELLCAGLLCHIYFCIKRQGQKFFLRYLQPIYPESYKAWNNVLSLNGNPLQHSCLESPMDGGAWQAIVHRVEKSWTWLSNLALWDTYN